ncbi:hypothetical protein PUR34_14710 [Streptomyces sp. JV185]|nr:hypothetical protein [Streptomyces sp. JV185]MEE1769366.1 hypothetical protein [Streptomyces sp. JV185]
MLASETSAGGANRRIATAMPRTARQVFGLLGPSLAHCAVRRARPGR